MAHEGSTASAPSISARSQAAGFARLSGINSAIRRSTSTSSILSQSPSSTSSLIPPAQSAEPTGEELAAQIARELLEDQCVVDEELKRYEDAGTVSLSEQLYDLTREWERTEHVFPLLFRVAMDVLPVQASSVPCERVFSSSKETCALRRNRMSPKHMEGLQLLKFSYKQDRLTFTDDLLAKEVDYNISGPITSAAIDELVRTDRLSELRDLLANVDTD
ncbi:hypothetical protein H0H92_004231 [Tricholoma furcatifolium]|nr:hypothetical protein H0H92_004231 [Tricholoma furcatifolium]